MRYSGVFIVVLHVSDVINGYIFEFAGSFKVMRVSSS